MRLHALIALLGLALCVLLTACDNRPAGAVDEATVIRFNTLVEQATKHIEQRNFQAAETALVELDRMRGEVSDPMRQQIDAVRAALAAARGTPAQPFNPQGTQPVTTPPPPDTVQ